jgi:hypothetical protein
MGTLALLFGLPGDLGFFSPLAHAVVIPGVFGDWLGAACFT